IGTGPWMLESYRPNVSLTWVRNPNYFQQGLPYIERLEGFVDEDQASRTAAFIAGKYDVGYEFPGGILRTDWVQIKDTLKQNGPVPAAFKDWALPIDKLGEGARWYQYNPAEAKRMLAAAGHPNGFAGNVCFTTYGSSLVTDQMQLVLKYLKDVGIDAKLDQKEYGAYASTCLVG